jgi:hypothetical protein
LKPFFKGYQLGNEGSFSVAFSSLFEALKLGLQMGNTIEKGFKGTQKGDERGKIREVFPVALEELSIVCWIEVILAR